MIHKGDIKIVAQMLKNLEKELGDITFKAPLVIAPPTYNIVEELKAEGDWEILQKYSGFEFNDLKPKTSAREKYENILYLERPGCNLCMESKKLLKVTQLWQHQQGYLKEELLKIQRKKGRVFISSTPVVVLSTILGEFLK